MILQKNLDEQDQKNLIELCISDPSVFTRARPIIQPQYFDKKFHQTITYLLEFSQEYSSLPTMEQLNTNSRIDYNRIEGITGNTNLQRSVLDAIEGFAKKRALEIAIDECYNRIQKGDVSSIDTIIKDAQMISLKKDFGINFWENPEEWLNYIETEMGVLPTGWNTFDELMNGGLGWAQLNYVVAPANSGKSLCMQNMALNWSLMGYNVLFFTLEMERELVGKRMASMATNVAYRNIRHDVEGVSNKILYKHKNVKPGVLQLINLPIGCNTIDIEGLVKGFEIENNIIPHIIVVDYADIMNPCDARIDPNNISLRDKNISLELRNLARTRTHDGKPTMVLTASQITKDAMDEMEFGMSNIAGGTTKSHNADNIFSVRTNDAMRQRGEYEFKVLKARNAGAKDKKFKMRYNIDTLLIDDIKEVATNNEQSVATPTTSSPTMNNALQTLQKLKGAN